ncbi:MAG: DMT family transporter [Tissierellia bacterium]|nr:DMT family transporter [Tissierellia bacterium]
MVKAKHSGSFFILLAVLLWSFSGLIIKTVEADAIWITLIRSLAGGAFLSPFIILGRVRPTKTLLLAGIIMAVFLLSITITTQLSSAAMAISMQYTAPMYVIGYSFFQNRRIDGKKLIVMLLIFIGILFNIVDGVQNADPVVMWTGILIGLSFVLYSLCLQKIQGSPLGVISMINLVAAGFCLILLLLNYSPPPAALGDIMTLVLAGILISGLSYAFYRTGLHRVKIERALILCLLEPILNPIIVYFGNGEIPGSWTIIGILCILLGALMDIVQMREGS